MRGIYADIIREVTSAMPDYEVVLKPMPWRRGLSMVEQGTAFAIFPPYYMPDTRPYMWPYSQPMLDEELVVMCGASVAANTPQARFPARLSRFAFWHERRFCRRRRCLLAGGKKRGRSTWRR